MKGDPRRGCSTRPWTVWSAISTNRGHVGLRLYTNHWNPPSRNGRVHQPLPVVAGRRQSPRSSALRSRALKVLDGAEQLDSVVMVANIAPALQARTKGTIRLALQLLDRVAKRGASPSPVATPRLLRPKALVHGAPDIRGRLST